MKKQLFFGSALLAAIGAFAQTPAGKVNGGIKEVLRNKYVINENLKSVQDNPPVQTAGAQRSSVAGPNDWSLISQSMNFFGVLVPDSKPLYYNHELDAVSFVQRVSPNYTPNPVPSADAKSGVMVAMVSPNWGSTWDSTCIFNNDLYLTRYPQGGIFNPPGNTQLSNAYVVAMGPATTPPPQLWIGNWFASKKLDVYNNVADVSDPMSQQFITSIPVDSAVGKVDFCRQDFTITDDGLVRSLGGIYDAVNPTFSGFRGGRIVKGSFTAGHFVWASDSISLANTPTLFDAGTNNYFNQLDLVNMAWSESGQYGYVWFLGIRTGATGNNYCFQPIVWKTSNFGASWSVISSIDFNDEDKFAVVLDKLDHVEKPANWSDRRMPYFNYLEDMAGVVDANNELHLVSTVWAMRDTVTGSMWTYTNTAGDGQTYRYKHTAGNEVYIYDFSTKSVGGNVDWDVIVVDSMRTEAPGATSTGLGYNQNPWAVYDGSKQNSNARIQLSRTPDGQFIVYTWAESNTEITDAGMRWNNKPDIHVRLRDVNSKTVNPIEYDVTGESAEVNVKSQAFMHNVSPICKVTVGNFYDLKLPLKVSNSTSLKPEETANHYYSTAELSFTNPNVGIAENTLLASNSSLYPNPAQNSTVLQLDLNKGGNVSVTVMNTVGQVMSTSSTDAVAGKNKINVDIQGLSSGIYMVNVKADGANVTKKLIVK